MAVEVFLQGNHAVQCSAWSNPNQQKQHQLPAQPIQPENTNHSTKLVMIARLCKDTHTHTHTHTHRHNDSIKYQKGFGGYRVCHDWIDHQSKKTLGSISVSGQAVESHRTSTWSWSLARTGIVCHNNWGRSWLFVNYTHPHYYMGAQCHQRTTEWSDSWNLQSYEGKPTWMALPLWFCREGLSQIWQWRMKIKAKIDWS